MHHTLLLDACEDLLLLLSLHQLMLVYLHPKQFPQLCYVLSLDFESKIHCEIYFAFLDSDFVELKIEIFCDIMQEVLLSTAIFINMFTFLNVNIKYPKQGSFFNKFIRQKKDAHPIV